jgi:hypothetical protein
VSVIPKALLTGALPKSPSVNVVRNVPVAMLVLLMGEVMEDNGVPPLGVAQAQAEVCQVFCVNDQVLFLEWVREGRGNIPSLAQRCRRILRSHDAALSKAGIRSGHSIVKWFKASRQ